jgi:hypothetical protein
MCGNPGRLNLDRSWKRSCSVSSLSSGRVFDDYCVVSFTNLAPLLGLGLPFIWDLDKLRRRRRLGDELHQVILQEAQYVSATTLTE